jgi:hypothetical protein
MKSHPIFLLTALIGSLGLTVGCHQRSKSKPGPSPAATVGETTISVSELQAEIDQRKARGQRPEPEKILDELILREALVARARQLGLHEDSEVIRAYKNLLIARLKERELEPQLRQIEVSDIQIQPSLNPKDSKPDSAAAHSRDVFLYKARLEKRKAIEQTFREQAQAKVPIAIYKDNLSRIETPVADPTPTGPRAAL